MWCMKWSPAGRAPPRPTLISIVDLLTMTTGGGALIRPAGFPVGFECACSMQVLHQRHGDDHDSSVTATVVTAGVTAMVLTASVTATVLTGSVTAAVLSEQHLRLKHCGPKKLRQEGAPVSKTLSK